jgi:preprotein translocase subunit SecF
MLLRDFPVQDQGISRRLIGQQVSRELAEKGWQAVLLALVAILVYISWRFRLRYAIGAVAAILHDVIIALGLFAIFQVEVNLATIAAFLTIVGYSLNDTIVIYDRIRENLKLEKRKSVFEVINHSVNQSLSRTLNTSITTFIPVIILFIFGGAVLRGFSLALLVGVVVGTYSSMYIANPILYAWTMKAGGRKTAK